MHLTSIMGWIDNLNKTLRVAKCKIENDQQVLDHEK